MLAPFALAIPVDFFFAAAHAGLLWEERGPAIPVQICKETRDQDLSRGSWLFPSVSCAISFSASTLR